MYRMYCDVLPMMCVVRKKSLKQNGQKTAIVLHCTVLQTTDGAVLVVNVVNMKCRG